MNDLECPYCGSEEEICHDDGQGYEEGVYHQQECSNCNKIYVFTTSISFYYEAEKADCLNGGEHTYRATRTYPKECTQMECTQCGDIRKPTKEEFEIIMKEARNDRR